LTIFVPYSCPLSKRRSLTTHGIQTQKKLAPSFPLVTPPSLFPTFFFLPSFPYFFSLVFVNILHVCSRFCSSSHYPLRTQSFKYFFPFFLFVLFSQLLESLMQPCEGHNVTRAGFPSLFQCSCFLVSSTAVLHSFFMSLLERLTSYRFRRFSYFFLFSSLVR